MHLPELLPGTAQFNVVRLTKREFDDLSDYSCTLPTGTTIGKRWKRDQNAYRRPVCAHLHIFDGTREPDFRGSNWWMGQFVPDPKPTMGRDGKPATVGIRWSKIEVVG